jgi:hypothetical protein
MSANLELMKITGYTDKEFQSAYKKPYSVMINPESIKWSRSVSYNEEQPSDTSSASQKYKNTPSEKLSFEIVLDCTGVVNIARMNLAAEIASLEDIIYTYNGKIHRPNFVSIQWGKSFTFKGVLTSFDTSYTLFKPDGTPLRAKLSLSFSQYVSPKTLGKQDNQQSPDVTHMMDVVEGVSLPQMCQAVWKDESYYVQVARYNGLDKFRNLKNVDRLVFPPIIQPA